MKPKAFALVVHDRPEPCQALKSVLKLLGVDVFSVATCAGAVLLLEQTHPHLIFTDIELPDGTWTELINAADSATVPTCVIVVGPSNDPEVSQAVHSHGAFDFISPPFDSDTVRQVLRQALTLVRARRDQRSRAVA